ncbi:lipase [Plectosphaerella plurivora]|uniref:sn-1-specific diacylglycerol lipase n=1 Tax=Plectosphaerella plurivora TaxID=936078 RepID=A0A9P9ACX7_9PEZI|nr:lipase [Plectosphaerella plurivora]
MDSDDEDLDSGGEDQSRALDLARVSNAQSGPTVLPSHIASAVSLATRSSCLAIRVGTLIGSYGFDAARVTTLSSLELGRSILEGILARAGQEMLTRSNTDLSRADAETVIERSLENLHRAMSQVVFWTSTGFHVTSTTFSIFSDVSQLLLTSLDQFFGSTDSSRAIASIITLIRREFQNPVTGADGQQVGVVDLVMGLCALAYLQRKCWRLEEEESRRLGHEEIIWDVVVLNDGERIDVHEDSLYGVHKGAYQDPGPNILISTPGPTPSPSILATLQRHSSQDTSDEEDDESPETRLRSQIMQTLPADAKVSISTTTLTEKTITVDFQGTESPVLSPPPGVEIVEREFLPTSQSGDLVQRQSVPTQRVVYKVSRTKTRSTNCHGHADSGDYAASVVESVDSDDDDDASPVVSPPAPPPRFPIQSMNSSLLPRRVSSSGGSPQAATAPPRPTGIRKPSKPELKRPTTPRPSPGRSSPPPPPPPVKNSPENNISNQKRQRTPLAPLPAKQPRLENARPSPTTLVKPPLHKSKTDPVPDKPKEKKTGIRQALKRAPVSNLSNLWHKDPASSGSSSSVVKEKKASRLPPPPPEKPFQRPPIPTFRATASRATGPTIASNQREKPPGLDPATLPRSSSRASYISVHESRRDSIVSQTDTFSVHSMDMGPPPSPMFARRRPSSSFLRQTPSRDLENDVHASPRSIRTRRGMHRGHTPSLSLYSIATSGSQASLVLSSMHPKSAYTDSEAIDTLRRAGTLDGIFPSFHLLRNVTRFMRFSSASYGSRFLNVMGISAAMPPLKSKSLENTHLEIRAFAHHTEIQPESVLLASFVDSHGGSDTTGSTGTGVPLVHYISLDHESKAVVLACRGTLGFEDVLADLACDYDDLHWRGKAYQVHKGVHASARRLLYGADGRILYTLKEALDEFKDYGLVLCGHSLGGAVTALLGTMLAEPSPTGTGFVTSAEPHRRLLTSASFQASGENIAHICLPAGRPLHVYAYGPPGTMSPALRKATRGLITSTIQGNDLVPFLSLGVLHDFQAVALAFKNDGHDARVELKHQIRQAFQTGIADRWYTGGGAVGSGSRPPGADGESPWSLAALTSLRAGMNNPKLLPPGEVFVVESSKVLRRDAFFLAEEENFGRPAQRVVFKYVRDVEARFREARFGTSMLMDHSPAKYEAALGKLRLGVADVR